TPTRGRRIAVLGDMLNLGYYQEEAHRELGRRLPNFVDYLVTYGEYAALIAEEAKQAGMDSAHIITTSTHEDAAQIVRHLLEQSASCHKHDAQINSSSSVGAAIHSALGAV